MTNMKKVKGKQTDMILGESEDPVSVIHIGRNCVVQKWDMTPIYYEVFPFISIGSVPRVPQCRYQEYSVYSDRWFETETWAVVKLVG